MKKKGRQARGKKRESACDGTGYYITQFLKGKRKDHAYSLTWEKARERGCIST